MTKDFNYKRRRRTRIKNQNHERAAHSYAGNFVPRADRKLRKFFSEIGIPEQSAFVADDFQDRGN